MSDKNNNVSNVESDYLTDFQAMQEKWDTVLKSGMLKQPKKAVSFESEYIASVKDEVQKSDQINDADYWSAIYNLSKGEESELIQEVRKLYPPNPTISYSYGQDQSPVITPGWIDGDDLNKLNKMKMDLHNLGNKLATLNSKDGGVVMQGKEPGKDLLEKIKKLQDEIDDLSDSLAPGKQQDTQS